MKLGLTLIFTLLLSLSFGQSTYRMFFKAGGYSMLYGGLKTHTMALDASVAVDGVTEYMYFNTEEYQLNYKKFQMSGGGSAALGINIAEGKRYKLAINGQFGYGKFKSESYATRISQGSISPYGAVDPAVISISTEQNSTITHAGTEMFWGGKLQFIFKTDILNIGPAIGLMEFRRIGEMPSTVENYLPVGLGRQEYKAMTRQLSIGLNIEKNWDWFGLYVNVSQAVLTTKTALNKGLFERQGDTKMIPSGQNLDYRFPTIFELGLNFSFAPIRNGCGTCPNW